MVRLWPTVGQALGLKESTTYKYAKEGTLPVKVVQFGGVKRVRTVDLLRVLGLTDAANAQHMNPTEDTQAD